MTSPPRRLTASISARVTSPTGRSGVSASRLSRPSLCSTTASWLCRSSATMNAPEPSGAGKGSVSRPRALRRKAACCSCGSGGASTAASFPSTWEWACTASRGSRSNRRTRASAMLRTYRHALPTRSRTDWFMTGGEPLMCEEGELPRWKTVQRPARTPYARAAFEAAGGADVLPPAPPACWCLACVLGDDDAEGGRARGQCRR